MRGIFICYRRDDSIAYAGRLYDRLTTHFGKEHVFMDIDTLEPGVDFLDALKQTVAACGILIAVIGKLWLTSTDDEGRPRLDNPHDLVRIEIATALERGIRVIPVLVAGAHIPLSQDVPDCLTKLTRRQAIEVRDTTFHSDVTKLIDALQNAILKGDEESMDVGKTIAEEKTSAESAEQRNGERLCARKRRWTALQKRLCKPLRRLSSP